MKKGFGKKILGAGLVLTLVFGLIGCGKDKTAAKDEKGEAKANTAKVEKTGFYASTQNVAFLSAFPEHTFKQATFGIQTLETYSDDTYLLTSTTSSFSGKLEFNDNGSYETVPRGADVVQYYGTFKSTDEGGLLTVELSQPKTVITNSSYSAGGSPIGYLNTDDWTDEMAVAAGGEEGELSAEDYLAKMELFTTTIIIDTTSASFDYIELSEPLTASK